MKKLVFLSIAVLLVACVTSPFYDLPQIVRFLPLVLLAVGLFLCLSGLRKTLNKPSPAKLSGFIARKEFYGFALVVVAWVQLCITH